MNLLNIGVLISLMTFGLACFANENSTPDFKVSPAKPIFTGKPAPLMTLGFASLAKGHRIPYFEDYPAKPMFTGKPAKIVLETQDAKNYRTRLREAMKEPADFAGEYVLAHWGCGTSCAHGAVVSLRTGHVVFLPGTVCCWYGDDNNTEYRKDSRLLILRGRINEGEPYGKHFLCVYRA
jgi:hypothetical protein